MKSKVALVACDSYEREKIMTAARKAVDLLGGMKKFVSEGQNVLLKPNLCLAEPPKKGITTHPEIVRALALMCKEQKGNVIIGDNPVGDADRSRLNSIWQKSGIAATLEDISYKRSFLDNNMKAFYSCVKGKKYDFYVSKDVMEMDMIINIPKFKTHSLMTFTGSVKNLYGLLPGNSKKKLHSELPVHEDFATLLVDIYKLIQPGLHIMDAVIGLEGDGPGVAGQIRKIGLIMASTDGLALDSVATRLMNLDPENVPTNLIGVNSDGGKIDVEIVGENIDKFIMKDFKTPMTFYRPDVTKKIFDLSRAYVKIDSSKCKGCNLCILNCPTSCIDLDGSSALINQEKCISCMTCHEICPEGAIFTKRSNFYKQLTAMRDKHSN